jgi:uncharacterized membrane protein
MTRKLAPFYALAWRGVLALLTVEIAVVSLARYVTGGADAPPPVLANAFANPFLLMHVLGGVTALVLGPLQFVRRIRERTPTLHRINGRIFVAASAIAAPTGFMLALGTTAGRVAAVGFAIPAVLWAVFTSLGVRSVLHKRFEDHREWMIRSYAIVSNAITLRVMLPLSAVLGFDFLPAYRTISWLGWITNLLLFEAYLRRTRRSAPTFARLSPA